MTRLQYVAPLPSTPPAAVDSATSDALARGGGAAEFAAAIRPSGSAWGCVRERGEESTWELWLDCGGGRGFSGLLSAARLARVLWAIGEDPRDQEQLAATWHRWRTPADPSRLDDWLTAAAADDGRPSSAARAGRRGWVRVDLPARSVTITRLAGDHDSTTESGGCAQLANDQEAPGDDSLTEALAGLPAWWNLIETRVTAGGALPPGPAAVGPRTYARHCQAAGGAPPAPSREVLWGPPLTDWIAAEMFHGRLGGRVMDIADPPDPRFLARLHRRWLSEPRTELQGFAPLDCLRGGRDWVARRIADQSRRVRAGYALAPLPRTIAERDDAPFGLHEVIMYFDACRGLLTSAWHLTAPRLSHQRCADASVLASQLRGRLVTWLLSVNADGEIPAEVIRDERLRIPAGLASAPHRRECDCPLCLEAPRQIENEAELLPVPAGAMLVLRPLGLDRPSAAAAEASQIAETDRAPQRPDHLRAADQRGHEVVRLADHAITAATRWYQPRSEHDPLNRFGPLALGYRVAAIVGVLEDAATSRRDIDALCGAFAAYQSAGTHDRAAATKRLHQILQRLRLTHPPVAEDALRLQQQLADRLHCA
jgi:hypothetical protein